LIQQKGKGWGTYYVPGSNYVDDSAPVDSKEELPKEVEVFLDNIGLCQNKKRQWDLVFCFFH